MSWSSRPRSTGEGGLACFSTGQGAPLVLIHGVGLRSESWGALLPDLGGHRKVFAADMPGHGESAALPDGDVSLDGFVARFAAFIAPFGRPVDLAGHSMGAMIALQLAIEHPERVRTVMALNAVFQRDESAKKAVAARAERLSSGNTPDLSAPLDRWFGPATDGQHPQERRACRDWLQSCDPAGYATAYRVFATHDGPDPAALARLHCPALFLTGAQEPNSTPAMSRAMAERAPDGTVQIIEGAAHMALMTHPAPVAQAMLSHLQHRGRR